MFNRILEILVNLFVVVGEYLEFFIERLEKVLGSVFLFLREIFVDFVFFLLKIFIGLYG